MSKELELIAAAQRLIDIMPDEALPKILALVVNEWNNRMYGMDALLGQAIENMQDSDARDEFKAALEDWRPKGLEGWK